MRKNQMNKRNNVSSQDDKNFDWMVRNLSENKDVPLTKKDNLPQWETNDM